jgi:membrane peptidoglycan carboxypeptidase
VSNPDLPGPYWQDQGDGGYDSGWRAGRDVPSRQQPAWDDGSFWRDDRSGGRAGRDSRERRDQADRYRESGRPRREQGRDGDRGSHRDAGRSGSRARRPADNDRGDWTDRLSQTAGDLRSKLGNMRTRAANSLGGDRGRSQWRGDGEDGFAQGAARNGTGGNGAYASGRGTGSHRHAGPADDDFRAEPGGRRAGSAPRGSGSRPGDAARGRAGRGGDYYGPGDYGAGDYGRSDYGRSDYGAGDYGAGDYDSRVAGGRTAVREPAGDFWEERDRTSRGLRSRIADGQLTRGGGNGRGGGSRGGGHGGGRYNGDPRSRGRGFKNWLLYGRWWRHWTWKKALAVAGAGIAACFLLGIAAFFIVYEMTPIPTAAEMTAKWQSSTVDFANGQQMGTYDDSINGVTVDRILLNSSQIPPLMTKAMAAAEDRHFYTEGGVSLTALVRAALSDILGHGNTQGASTITMQYVKNYYNGVNTGRNFSTKIKEIFIAEKLGHDETKTWVMTNYLNTVPFGATIDGLGAAAENYFDINLTRPGATLTVGQAAMLAALPNDPAVFSSALQGSDPAGLALLKGRFAYVLAGMVKDGAISQQVANTTAFPKLNPPPAGNGETGVTGYLMNMVEQQLEAPYADGGYELTQQKIDTGGYKITTTFSMAKIKALARSVSYEKDQMKADAAASGGVYVSFRNYDRIGAVLENANTGAIVAVYGGPGYPSSDESSQKQCLVSDCQYNMAEAAEQVGSSFKPYVLSAAVNEGMSVVTSRLNGYSPIWIPLSMAAGATATELTLSPTHAPPGCSASASDCILPNGDSYFKFDETNENSGRPLPVNVAAAISSDPAFEDLAHRDGIQQVIEMAQAFGVGQNAFVEPCGASEADGASTVAQTIQLCNDLTGPSYKVGKNLYQGDGLETNFSPSSKDPYARNIAGTPGSPAIALGENPLTPIEQATTFATLSDDGVYHTPHVVQLLQQNGTTIASHLTTRRVLKPAQAADVDYALSFDNQLPTGTAYNNVPFRRGDVIGKTGTLGEEENASEAWFVGGLPDEWAMAVALFTNLPGTENLDNLPWPNDSPGSQGGGWPAFLWNDYMTNEFTNAKVIPLWPVVSAGFQAWIQVKAQKVKKPFCKPGIGHQGGGNQQGCICPPHAQFCGHPNPGPSCNANGNGNGNGNGNCASPSPSTSCQGFGGFGGQQCGSPSPSTTPTVSPSVSPSPSCSGPPGQCGAAALTSYVRSSPGSGSSPGSAASVVVLAAEEASRLTALLGLLI